MTIAKPLQVVCSPRKSTSNFRPRVAYLQRCFGPMCPSSVFFLFSPTTLFSRNLSRKHISKVFSGFSGGPWQLPSQYKWCALLSTSEATSDHGWLILKDVSGQCALNFVCYILFFYSSPNTILSGNLSSKIIPKVFSVFSGGPWQLPNYYKWCAILPKSQTTSHKLYITGCSVSTVFENKPPVVWSCLWFWEESTPLVVVWQLLLLLLLFSTCHRSQESC